ncbi:MAG: YIP1 family protein [Spirochaetales bacterium]|nr:YIP1 family protein [Spirochaetales bacterium]
MKNGILLWKEIITEPSRGFTQIGKDTKIFLPLLVILALTLVATALLLPIVRSPEYTKAVITVQEQTMQEKGSPLSREQAEAMADQLSSDRMKTITTVSTLVGGLFGYLIMLMVSWLLFKLILVIFKTPASMGLLFKVLVYLALFTAVQSILKTVVTLSGNWERMLALVQTTDDFKMALQSPISLAALVSYKKVGTTAYFIIDTLTDIFNYLYYGYLYVALHRLFGMEKRKALFAVLVCAVLFIGAGFILTLLT